MVISWDEFVGMLCKQYCPMLVRTARARDFFSARPQNLSILEIVQQYRSELSYIADLCPSETQRICHLE